MNTVTQEAAEIKTQVVYDRKEKVWQTVNGTVESFPAGPEGKRAALLAALAHDHPLLSAIVGDIAATHNHNPHLVDRLIKAAQLIEMGHVYANDRVKSQDPESEEVYRVTYLDMPRSWHCTCQDFTNGMQRQAGLSKWGGVDTDYGLMCKHSLAVLVAFFAGLELEDEEIPF